MFEWSFRFWFDRHDQRSSLSTGIQMSLEFVRRFSQARVCRFTSEYGWSSCDASRLAGAQRSGQADMKAKTTPTARATRTRTRTITRTITRTRSMKRFPTSVLYKGKSGHTARIG